MALATQSKGCSTGFLQCLQLVRGGCACRTRQEIPQGKWAGLSLLSCAGLRPERSISSTCPVAVRSNGSQPMAGRGWGSRGSCRSYSAGPKEELHQIGSHMAWPDAMVGTMATVQCMYHPGSRRYWAARPRRPWRPQGRERDPGTWDRRRSRRAMMPCVFKCR